MAKKRGRAKAGDKEMSFLEHLEELRWHIIRSVIAVVLLAIVAFIFKDIIFDTIILAPRDPAFITNRLLCELGTILEKPALCINTKYFEIINIKMAGQFTTHISVSLVAGIILAFPYIFWEFWSFFRPALYQTEKRHASGAVFFSSLLFLLGVLFGYYLIAPLSIHFLGSYNLSDQVVNQINLKSYIGTLTSVSLASGLVFELPMVTFFLTKIGIVDPPFLRKYRKHSIVVMLILSAIITPPDIFSQVLVCIPLLILYELGILISSRVIRKEKKRAAAMESASSKEESGTL